MKKSVKTESEFISKNWSLVQTEFCVFLKKDLNLYIYCNFFFEMDIKCETKNLTKLFN